MNNFHLRLFLSLVFLIVATRGISQNIERTLNTYFSAYQPERLHFHLDKDEYASGDTVWFKVYVMAGFKGTDNSKNLYVDWIDDRARLLAHQVYPITSSGITCGLFAIPGDFAGKVLHIHAYTKWMLNFDSTFLYNRDIRIVHQKNTLAVSTANGSNSLNKSSASSDPVSSTTTTSINPTITFFPEGGNMVAGIGSRIAFLCCDQWGRPVTVSGDIKDSKGNKVADIQTTHDGMGDFWFQPAEGETYTANWKDEQGIMYQTTLPSALSEGIVLTISDVGDNKKFVLQRSDNAPSNLKQLYIVATMQQEPVYMAAINLTSENGTTGMIPQTGLPAGGMVVTVFDSNWQPVAERLCFIDHLSESTFKPQITWEKKSLDKRGYNQLLITIPDSIPANLSLSITDAGLPTDSIDNNNILSELLLTGDIRGRVYNPDYYFTDTSATIKQNLDLVILTHGWRRYDWSKIVKGEYPTIQYPRDTSYYTFSGKVSGISKKKIAAARTLFTFFNGADLSTQTQIIALNKDGSFTRPNILLFDSTKIYYRLNGIKGPASYINLKLNQPVIFPGLRGYSIARNTPIYAPNTANAPAINKRQFFFMTKEADLKAHELAPVTVTAHKKTQIEKMDDLYVNNPLFKSNPTTANYIIDVEHNPASVAYTNIFAYLQGRVPGLSIDESALSNNGVSHDHIFDEGSSISSTSGNTNSNSQVADNESPVRLDGGEPVFFVNEAPASLDQVKAISVDRIAMVKAFQAPFIGAPMNRSAIVIYTKRGDDIDANTNSMSYVIAKGYTPLKEFYLPNYKGKDSVNQNDDIRQTIYWDPILLTIKNANKIRLGFYNNDVTKAFRIKLEGIDKEGKLTYLEEVVHS